MENIPGHLYYFEYKDKISLLLSGPAINRNNFPMCKAVHWGQCLDYESLYINKIQFGDWPLDLLFIFQKETCKYIHFNNCGIIPDIIYTAILKHSQVQYLTVGVLDENRSGRIYKELCSIYNMGFQKIRNINICIGCENFPFSAIWPSDYEKFRLRNCLYLQNIGCFNEFPKMSNNILQRLRDNNFRYHNMIRASVLTLLGIRKYRKSLLNYIPKELVKDIAKEIWTSRNESIWNLKEPWLSM